MNSLSSLARAYIASNMLLGAVSIWRAAVLWNPQDLRRAFIYLAFAILASPLKVVLPGINSTMSVNYVCILVSVSTLNMGNAVFIALACTLTQCLWNVKCRPQAIHLAFNLMSASAATVL